MVAGASWGHVVDDEEIKLIAHQIYEACFARASAFLEEEFPDSLAIFIAQGEMIQLGMHAGISGTILHLQEAGYLDNE
jgi:hypothetical protein